ncbi:uncharacterized protein LOC128549017 [Mercenaria mercenaria]|uniref:uncharacterized protein LOC128549017 n=1 Tax=Mercenaria mercenaria TaxID=6596 RepID=UPI00234F64C3|nr:uncharacterized protein LOC128549017 [Mercenaria mercenaria]
MLASSASTERVFSNFGSIQTKLRNRLGIEKTTKLVFSYTMLCDKEELDCHMTEKEEDVLVNLRHELHDDFLKTKNHAKLWERISEELPNIGCKVTNQEALNKYSSLKKQELRAKKYKEVIDAPSGSEKKFFRHLENFNLTYGTKSSTKPKATVDTMEETERSFGQKQTGDTQGMETTVKSDKQEHCLAGADAHLTFLSLYNRNIDLPMIF